MRECRTGGTGDPERDCARDVAREGAFETPICCTAQFNIRELCCPACTVKRSDEPCRAENGVDKANVTFLRYLS
jgi:hypothetical protein